MLNINRNLLWRSTVLQRRCGNSVHVTCQSWLETVCLWVALKMRYMSCISICSNKMTALKLIVNYRQMWNTEPRAIYSRPKIPVWMSGNFQWRMDQNLSEYFWKTEEPREVCPSFLKFLTENFRYIEVFPVFSRIFWLNCSHFGNSTVFEFTRNCSRIFPVICSSFETSGIFV